LGECLDPVVSPPVITGPAACGVVTTSATADLEFLVADLSGIDHVRIDVREAAGCGEEPTGGSVTGYPVSVPAASPTTYTLQGLSPATWYKVTVESSASVGYRSASDEEWFQTDCVDECTALGKSCNGERTLESCVLGAGGCQESTAGTCAHACVPAAGTVETHCGTGGTKQVRLLLLYDPTAAAVLGSDPRQTLASVVGVANTLFADGGFSPSIELAMASAVARADVVQRPCNTSDLFATTLLPSSNVCCSSTWYSAPGCPTNPECVSNPNNVNLFQPACFEWGGTSWSTYGSRKKTTYTVLGVVSTSASAIDGRWALDDVGARVEAHLARFETVARGPFDQAVFITGNALPRGNELTFVGTVCRPAGNWTRSAAGVMSLARSSGAFTVDWAGSLLAHVVGHALSFGHDAASGWVMSPQLVDPAPTQFSAASRSAWSAFLSLGPTCLDDEPPMGPDHQCGDGVVDGGEQCDVGAVHHDPCCDMATCQFVAGCACSTLDVCCTSGGTIVNAGAGKLCRAAVNATCDMADYCDGVSALCPADHVKAPVVECRSGVSTCYGGLCLDTRLEQCQALLGAEWIACGLSLWKDACDRLYCAHSASPGSCSYVPGIAPLEGTKCGTDLRCHAGACVSWRSMVQWWAGAWSSCVNGTQVREVACVDLEGNHVDLDDCMYESYPPAETQACP
jgi:hypothetical protein